MLDQPGGQPRLRPPSRCTCRWRAAWAPARGSVTKAALPVDPQEAVVQEGRDWAQVWGGLQRQDRWWRQFGAGQDAGPVDTATLRRVCRAYKQHTGLGVDGGHLWHWSWLSEEALSSLGEF